MSMATSGLHSLGFSGDWQPASGLINQRDQAVGPLGLAPASSPVSPRADGGSSPAVR